MKMTKLATLFLTATLSLASGAALAADSGAQTNNGQANAAAAEILESGAGGWTQKLSDG